ncbi:MAG: hypothetical protein V4702_02385 [Patescibacteria group bacterium]
MRRLIAAGLLVTGTAGLAYANNETLKATVDNQVREISKDAVPALARAKTGVGSVLRSVTGRNELADSTNSSKTLPPVSGSELVAIADKLRAMSKVVCKGDLVKPGETTTTTTQNNSVEVCVDAPHAYIKTGRSISWLVLPLLIVPPSGSFAVDVVQTYANASDKQCEAPINIGRPLAEETVQVNIDENAFRTKGVPMQIVLDRHGSTPCDEPPYESHTGNQADQGGVRAE